MPVTISGTTGIGTPAINATGAVQAASVNATGNIVGTGVCPVGVVLPFALATAPTGWLRCDGTTIPTSGPFQDVADASILQTLRGLLGTTYGATLGTLPNLQGQFIRGLTTNLSTASRDPLSASRLLGNVQEGGIAQHQHRYLDYVPEGSNSPDPYGGSYYGGGFVAGTLWRYNVVRDTLIEGSAPAWSPETRPVNIALLYCIKY
jgi:hypothetical protein